MAYQVLIIDDEEIVCRGMAQFIKWQEHGFSVAGTVYLAKEGLKFLENHHVDVIFLDIRMPEMTGLEMLKIISAKYPSIKTVILSGFSEFFNKFIFFRKYFKFCTKSFIKAAVNLKDFRYNFMSDSIPRIIYGQISGVCNKILPSF